MIVVDSSVWIGLMRGQNTPAVVALQHRVAPGDILIGDIILLELLQGARNDAHAGQIEQHLRQFPIVSMLNDRLAVMAATNYRLLRGKGITPRKTIDMIIATFCLAGTHDLLCDDRDFRPIADHLGLRLLSLT